MKTERCKTKECKGDVFNRKTSLCQSCYIKKFKKKKRSLTVRIQKGYTNKPQNIDKNNWYYEDKRGVELIHEIWIAGQYIRTDNILIRWKQLDGTLERRSKLK